ncbi:hypothetical protein N7517_008763 [Penicillium concentricum]|uniref:Uncharacterized protein n=1 Tax=Penicillium concentricum TaxID=293559 RepID=A0A9W9V1Z2_9EURO|nr:uncharacterized protein N7517_008763 [Penicillium concentricum]KAJ5365877.1 hypothetical protein N7517_008763 [Penicillium concentricum]
MALCPHFDASTAIPNLVHLSEQKGGEIIPTGTTNAAYYGLSVGHQAHSPAILVDSFGPKLRLRDIEQAEKGGWPQL